MSSSISRQISKEGPYQPEKGRYHLYVGLGCPFAHRALIALYLKGLEDVIDISIVHYEMKGGFWVFNGLDDTTLDKVNGFSNMQQVYLKSHPDYAGKCTVPALWDKKTSTIVNNESAELMRIFNTEFNEFAKYPEVDLYPESLRSEIDPLIEKLSSDFIFKVYTGSTQEKYEEAYKTIFKTLDYLEERLKGSRYLIGNKITEADIKLFVGLIRFDPVFHSFYKFNLKYIRDYPVLSDYLRDLYQTQGIKESVSIPHIKGIYYKKTDNPEPRIIPLGPDLSYLDIPTTRTNF
eukprot:gene4901-6112_t